MSYEIVPLSDGVKIALATKEAAVVCDIDVPRAREALGRVGVEEHVGFDGLWSQAA